ncbi:MAG: GTP-binding protein, partial [Clostridia bacterium]|nr:GTP-binding protein [Clostridia bacterium]
GCICCSLVGDFAEALKKVATELKPDRILIEPSGVGKLSDVVRAVERADIADAKINSLTAVVDANKCKIYMKNFGEFFNDQIESAACIVFSHADVASSEKLATALKLVREHNAGATVVTTEWDKLDGKQILEAMEHASTLESELEKLTHEEEEEHGHHCCHHHDDDDEEHDHEHGHCCHHHDEEEEEEHGHHCCHHHDDDDEEHDHEHGHCHHHDHDHEHEHGHHHHHHHADDVFTSWGVETSSKFTEEGLKAALAELSDSTRFGTVLRAKGIVAGQDGKWLHFDYVPGEVNVRCGSAEYTGRLCVIGSKIDEEELKELFGV